MRLSLWKYLFLFALLTFFCPAGAEAGKVLCERTPAIYRMMQEKLLEAVFKSDNQGKSEKDAGLTIESFFDELVSEEIAAGKYFRLIDEKGRLITITGRRIRPGDRYLDEKNRLYEVSSVRGFQATARYLRTEKIKKPERPGTASSYLSNMVKGNPNLDFSALHAGENETDEEAPGKKIIAIYHTHNDECYVPTDGTESTYGHGGIHQVGAALQRALEAKNITALHSEHMHLPHDDAAYLRSRDTALQLLQQDPDAIFDIHRDAAPMDAYAVEIDEDWVTKIQFVVGRENPTSVVTSQFAYDMKGLSDDIYPGLIKGIFMGWGVYNQDLTPLNLLLEVGAHENSRDAAEKSMNLFADVVAKYFYGTPVAGEERTVLPRAEQPGAVKSSTGGTIAVIILLVAAALSGFYFLNNPGSWGRFRGELGHYLGRNGVVWQDGFHNVALMGKKIVLGLRSFFVYVIIFAQLLQGLFLKIRGKLRGLK